MPDIGRCARRARRCPCPGGHLAGPLRVRWPTSQVPGLVGHDPAYPTYPVGHWSVGHRAASALPSARSPPSAARVAGQPQRPRRPPPGRRVSLNRRPARSGVAPPASACSAGRLRPGRRQNRARLASNSTLIAEISASTASTCSPRRRQARTDATSAAGTYFIPRPPRLGAKNA